MVQFGKLASKAKVLFCSKWVWVNQKRERERERERERGITQKCSYKDDVELGLLGYFCV